MTPDGPADERARESADGEADQNEDQDWLNYLYEPHSRAERLDHGDRSEEARAAEGSAQRVSNDVVVLAAHASTLSSAPFRVHRITRSFTDSPVRRLHAAL